MRPKRWTAWRTMRSTSPEMETSHFTKLVGTLVCRLISAATPSPKSTETSASTTLIPDCANARAVARPIPEAAPVTRATLSLCSIAKAPIPVFDLVSRHEGADPVFDLAQRDGRQTAQSMSLGSENAGAQPRGEIVGGHDHGQDHQ